MKTFLIILCLTVTFMQSTTASIQTKSSMDKQPRLYVESYSLTNRSDWNGVFNHVYNAVGELTYSASLDEHDCNTISWGDGNGGQGNFDDNWNQFYSDNELGTGYGEYHAAYIWPTNTWETLSNGIVTQTYQINWTNQDPIIGSNTYVSYPAPVIQESCAADYSVDRTRSESWPDWLLEYGGTFACHRDAQAVMKLETGGRGGSQRLNLFCLSASADAKKLTHGEDYDQVIITNLGPIAVANIMIMGKSLGNDGNLWVLLPDGTNIDVTPLVKGEDYYTFSVPTPPKYHLYIGLSTSTTNANLDTDTPEVCVGQTVTLGANWQSGNTPPADADIRWHLPEKYVNEQYQYSSTCTSYRINADLLTNRVQQCWYVNLPGRACSVREILHFANGQNITVAARGDFTVYRPSVSAFHNVGNGFEKTAVTLEGTMTWDATFDSKYNGYIGATQIISCNNENSDYYTAGYNLQDGNAEIYGEPGSAGPKRYDVTNPQTHYTILGDNPTDYLTPCANMIANFKDYLRFQPDGGIWVTIATVDWHMNGDACLIGDILPNDLPPASPPVDTDAFPLWDGVRSE